jgi:hypothetical protein
MPSKSAKKSRRKSSRKSTPLNVAGKLLNGVSIECEIPINFVRAGILTGLEYSRAILATAIGEMVASGATVEALSMVRNVHASVAAKADEIRRS